MNRRAMHSTPIHLENDAKTSSDRDQVRVVLRAGPQRMRDLEDRTLTLEKHHADACIAEHLRPAASDVGVEFG
jgi:hypothetical protein